MALQNGQRYHIAALLWRRNKLIRIGINGIRHKPGFARYYHKAIPHHNCLQGHAEMDAMLAAQPGDTLIVLRWLKTGRLACARPCQHCQNRIAHLSLRVQYSDQTGRLVRLD